MSDLQNLPNVQIRDSTYVIQTPSLLIAGSEPVPDEIIRDLLIQEWIATESAPSPTIIIRDELIQGDLRKSDFVIVTVENYTEQPTGHRHEFVDLEVPMNIEFRTTVSRQRLWNLMAESRRILYRWMFAVRPYQLMYFDGFQPDYLGPNNFSGTSRLRLTAGAIPIFTRYACGGETPAANPD